MKQLIVITSAIGSKVDLKKAKIIIKEYVGIRMLDTDISDDAPGVLLKEPLCKEDKKHLQEEIFPNEKTGCLIFMNVDEDVQNVPEYINATIVDDND